MIYIQTQGLLRDVVKAYGVNADGRCGRIPKEVSWIKPVEEWITLNVDGSAINNPGMAGFGGLMRDCDGCFLHGFYGTVGVSDILHAKLMALFQGVPLCWELGYRKVNCYLDSLHTMKLIEEGDQNFHRFGNEIALIRSMLSRN